MDSARRVMEQQCGSREEADAAAMGCGAAGRPKVN
jgi:hypothetical protein